jgi:hypothetical protein
MKKILTGLIVSVGLMVSVMAGPVYAEQDFHESSFMNNFTDWSVTIFKQPEERHRITNERIERRALWRQDRYRRNHQQDTRTMDGHTRSHIDKR